MVLAAFFDPSGGGIVFPVMRLSMKIFGKKIGVEL